MPQDVRDRYRGNVAVDGTFIPAFGRHGSYRSSDCLGIEPYAAWYVRDGEHGLLRRPRRAGEPADHLLDQWVVALQVGDDRRDASFLHPR